MHTYIYIDVCKCICILSTLMHLHPCISMSFVAIRYALVLNSMPAKDWRLLYKLQPPVVVVYKTYTYVVFVCVSLHIHTYIYIHMLILAYLYTQVIKLTITARAIATVTKQTPENINRSITRCT